MKNLISPASWNRAEDGCLFLLRMFVGAFLIWGVWDNIISDERMAKFTAFLNVHGFVYPGLLAPVSVWAQFACGIAFVAGLGARWGGLLCALNFVVALVMVDAQGGIRQVFPAAMLMFFGLYLSARGAGRYPLDDFLTRVPNEQGREHP
jgi:putative oxidoreductase